MKRKSILKTVIKVIYGVFKTCLLAFLLIFALIVCLQRFSNNSVSFFNYRLFSVVTGSMVPKYDIGDVLLCKEVDPETLVVGDDISYVGIDGTYNDKVITHRIIKIEKDETGKLLFYTKGIATKTVDPVVKEEQIYGKITGEVGFLSALYKFISTSKGFYIAIIVPLVLLIGSEIIVTMVEKKKDKEDSKKKKVVSSKSDEPKELSLEDAKKAELKAEIEKVQKEIELKKKLEEEKKKQAIKEEIERLQKEIDSKK